jgi:hypothetical protein
MRLVLLAAFLLITASTFAQDYIVSMKGDTLRGEVRLLSYDLMDRVQLAVAKKKTVYTAVQLRRVWYKSEEYAPVKHDNAIRLMKVVRTGFMSLYSFRLPNQMAYDGRLLVKLGSLPQEVPNLGFKRFVGAMVEDCPVVADRVKNGDLDRTKVEELVELYNKCVEANQAQRFEAAAEKVSNPTLDFINQMKDRVNASDLATKSDVNDLLNNISDKVKKNEPVPGYLKEGLKGYLGQRDDLKGDMEQLLQLLK